LSPRLCARSRRRGFTLFEVVLVLAVLALLAAFTYPSVEAMYGDYRVQAAADMVCGAWAEAKARAMNEGRAYRFEVQWYSSKYRIRPDTSDNLASPDVMDRGESNQGQGMVHEDDVPKGVRFTPADAPPSTDGPDPGLGPSTPSAPADPGSWVTVATFLPDGTAREDEAVVTLGSRGAKPIVVRLRGLTGIVTRKRADVENHRR
jgi:prepilin-type N-terminal cleavage/methylation domain-containing protein